MEQRLDSNLILNQIVQGTTSITVRDDSNAILNALVDGTAVLPVKIDGAITVDGGEINHLTILQVTGSTILAGGLTANTINIDGSIARGEKSFAAGDSTIADQAAASFGYLSQATGAFSFAEGTMTIADGQSSHAEGITSHASGAYSHAEGNGTIASGYYSHAEGSKTIASNNTTHAEGQYTTASGTYSHSGGGGNSNGHIIASGISSFNHSYTDGTAGPSYALGNYSAILGGVNNNVYGERSVVLGGTGIIGYSGDTVYVPKIEIIETTNQIVMVDAVTGLRNSIVLSGGTFVITEL